MKIKKRQFGVSCLLLAGIVACICIVRASDFAEVIAKSPSGIEVTFSEKYGSERIDTGTVISSRDGCYYVTHYDAPTTIYTRDNFSIVKTRRFECQK